MEAETNRDILAALPHRPPFRFVDEIVELDPGRQGLGIWRIDGRESFFAGHFPGRPIVPGVLVAEALAQMSGVVALGPGVSGFSSGKLAHVDLRFDDTASPPAEILLEVELVRSLGSLRQFDVSARIGDTVIARGTLALAGGHEGPSGGAAG